MSEKPGLFVVLEKVGDQLVRSSKNKVNNI